MLNTTLADIRRLAREHFDAAEDAADEMELPKLYQKSFSESFNLSAAGSAQLLTDDPQITNLEPFRGTRAWGAMASFDLRHSTKRALEYGARDTYITMHTYLPTMLAVAKAGRGRVVGLRGDGAILVFGHVAIEESPPQPPPPASARKAVSEACRCGAAMIRVLEAVVNPILKEGGAAAGLQMGVGVDYGEFVATNIGLERAFEVTAYGNCVNKACKRSGREYGNNLVVLTNEAKKNFPSSKGGPTRIRAFPGKTDAFVLKYPASFKPIE